MFSLGFGVFGFLLWMAAAGLYFIPGAASDVSIGNMRACELGVVAGGAFVVGAIALFAGSA